MLIQRYISSDLTHFVGRRHKTQRERYKLLKEILKTGLLKASPKIEGVSPLVRALRKDAGLRLSSNKACGLPAICFYDIPLCDLPLHMVKYKDFGIAFTKSFLADFGALPIVYVPKWGRPASLPYEGYARGSRHRKQSALTNSGRCLIAFKRRCRYSRIRRVPKRW